MTTLKDYVASYTLEELAIDAYVDEEMYGDAVHDALAELKKRGFSKDEVYHFVTWGDS